MCLQGKSNSLTTDISGGSHFPDGTSPHPSPEGALDLWFAAVRRYRCVFSRCTFLWKFNFDTRVPEIYWMGDKYFEGAAQTLDS